MKFNYYYNNTPEHGLIRNNLIYTSLISEDKKTFCQWYYNDTGYHKKKNQVVDPSLMNEKWEREVRFLTLMSKQFPDFVPRILDIDTVDKKIYLEIDSVDFWQQQYDKNCTYDEVLPDWQDQMLEILRAHATLGFYKFSLHPSSYFVVNGKLKSINYFFCAFEDEKQVPISSFRSHISLDRQEKLEVDMAKTGITWETVLPYKIMQIMTFHSFRSNYPNDFIDKALKVYD
jgi:hypothetical protein